MNQDLTVGKPSSVLWKFCLPLFGSVIFQQLYNIADSFVAGKFLGEDALAAVGNGYEITLIFIAVAFGCNIGCSVTVSRLFGAREYGNLKTAVYTTMLSCGVLCAVLTGAGLLCTAPLLRMIHTPRNVFSDSQLYLNIYIYGLPFLFFYNLSTGIFSALGDSKTPFVFLVFSSTVNVGVDVLFVSAFGMGVDGVAWATFLCQGFSCILALACILLRLKRLPGEGRGFSWRILGAVSRIAVPSILQQSFISVGNILIQSVINSFGSPVMAGYSAAVKLNNLVITSFTTLSNGISNYTAQNLGAYQLQRVREGFRAGLKLVWLLCVPLMAAYLFAGRALILLFLDNPTRTALETGVTYLRIVASFYLVASLKLVSDGVLRGAGKMGRFMIGTFTDLILRVALAYVLAVPFGPAGIWMAWPIGWVAATIVSFAFYRGIKLENRTA